MKIKTEEEAEEAEAEEAEKSKKEESIAAAVMVFEPLRLNLPPPLMMFCLTPPTPPVTEFKSDTSCLELGESSNAVKSFDSGGDCNDEEDERLLTHHLITTTTTCLTHPTTGTTTNISNRQSKFKSKSKSKSIKTKTHQNQIRHHPTQPKPNQILISISSTSSSTLLSMSPPPPPPPPPPPQLSFKTPFSFNFNKSPLTYTLTEGSQSAPHLSSPSHSDSGFDLPEWSWLNSSPPLPPQSNHTPATNIQSNNHHHHPIHSFSPSRTRAHHERSQSHGPPLLPHPYSRPTNSKSSSSDHSTRLERRFQALLEIYDTEAGYLRDLRILVHGYLAILERAQFVSSDHKSIVKRNVDQVLELAERFSRRISLAVGSKLELWRLPASIRDEPEVDKLIERLAKAFISESPIFTVYEDFCARHTEAADIIRNLEASPEWLAFLQQCRSADSSPAPSSSFSSQAHAIPLHNCLASLGIITSTSNHSRLRLQDFAIKPIQRIMRYPLLLASLLKYMQGETNPGEARARDKVYQALWAMKEVASGVDEAKSSREIELKTDLIASRMELHSSYRAAFVSLLGQIQLVGSLHVLYHGPVLDPNEAFKIKYHGIFLYQTHLVIVKVKRTTVYEPRHWFPIRYFDLVDIPESSGLMPHSFSLKYRQHTFEFGATWEVEKKLWMSKLKAIKEEVENLRAIHSQSDLPLNDDSIVSSINLDDSAPSAPPGSSSSTDTKVPCAGSPVLPQAAFTEEALSFIDKDDAFEELPTTPTGASQSLPPQPSSQHSQYRVSQRLSRNVNTLLGRTPEVAQAAIDLKLTEVFSEVLLTARVQGQREQEITEANTRQRTLSGVGSNKRHSQYLISAMPSANTFSTRAADRKLKRMSYMEPSSRIFAEPPTLPTPPLPTTLASPASIRSSSSSLRRAKTGPPAERPPSVHDTWRLNRASTTNSTRSRPPSAVLTGANIAIPNSPSRSPISQPNFNATGHKTKSETRFRSVGGPASRSASCDGSSSGTSSSNGVQAVERLATDRPAIESSQFSSPATSSGHSSVTTIQESSEDRSSNGRINRPNFKGESSAATQSTGSLRARSLTNPPPSSQVASIRTLVSGFVPCQASGSRQTSKTNLAESSGEGQETNVELDSSAVYFDSPDLARPISRMESSHERLPGVGETGGTWKMSKSATQSATASGSWFPTFKIARKLSRASELAVRGFPSSSPGPQTQSDLGHGTLRSDELHLDISREGSVSHHPPRQILSAIFPNGASDSTSTPRGTLSKRSGTGWVPKFMRSKSSSGPINTSPIATLIQRGSSSSSSSSSSAVNRTAFSSLWPSPGSGPSSPPLSTSRPVPRSPTSESVWIKKRYSSASSSTIRSFLRMTPLAGPERVANRTGPREQD